MKNLKRVLWTKGMFLSPQHFQTQDDCFEDMLQFRATTSSDCHWGLTHCEIDQESLANGFFTLRHCRGVFRDGLAFHIPDTDDPPPGRDIGPHFPPTEEHLDVYLALPEQKARGRHVAVQPEGSPVRYVAECRTVVDHTSGADERPIQVCARNFGILFGSELLDGNAVLPIARIARSATGLYTLEASFISPALSLEASETVVLMARGLVEVLAAKALSLSVQRKQKSRSQADFSSNDVGSFWLLHTINTHLPLLKHFWTQRRRHPEELYKSMLMLAGALTTFALSSEARNLPDYDHEHLGECFHALDTTIRELLETAIPSRCLVIPLTLSEKSTWSGSVPDTQLFQEGQFVLSVGADMPVEDLIKQVPRLVKVSPAAELPRLVRNALPGVTLRHLVVPPDGVPVKLDRQYFAISQNGILWEGISREQQLRVFVPEEIGSPKFELLVMKN